MGTNELKKLLIGKIDDTNDEVLLRAVYKLLDYHSTTGNVYMLTEKQKKRNQKRQRTDKQR